MNVEDLAGAIHAHDNGLVLAPQKPMSDGRRVFAVTANDRVIAVRIETKGRAVRRVQIRALFNSKENGLRGARLFGVVLGELFPAWFGAGHWLKHAAENVANGRVAVADGQYGTVTLDRKSVGLLELTVDLKE